MLIPPRPRFQNEQAEPSKPTLPNSLHHLYIQHRDLSLQPITLISLPDLRDAARNISAPAIAMSDSSDAAVLVPLYIYPFEGAWQPLYDAIAAHPRTQYLVVVNPGNGPGPGSLPDANYCREIPKLRSQPNVAVYGYVHVQWAQRDLETVLHDVEIYQAWPNHDATMAVDGIFVDETPTAADAPTVAFLGSLTSLVHRIWPNASGDSTSGDSPVAPTPVPVPGTGHGTGPRTAYNTPLPTVRNTLKLHVSHTITASPQYVLLPCPDARLAALLTILSLSPTHPIPSHPHPHPLC